MLISCSERRINRQQSIKHSELESLETQAEQESQAGGRSSFPSALPVVRGLLTVRCLIT